MQFTAHHNRAGIGPMLVASDRRRPVTGPPRQVHRIRALVCMYHTTIQIYKYKIIQKYIFKWRWGSDSPFSTAARNKSAGPYSRAPEECLSRRIESATQPLPRAIVQSGQPQQQRQGTQTASCRYAPFSSSIIASIVKSCLKNCHWIYQQMTDNLPFIL